MGKIIEKRMNYLAWDIEKLGYYIMGNGKK